MEGLLDRSWVAGVSPGEILFSHVVTQFVVMCGQTALVLIFMILVFGVECKGDIAWVIILTILQGLCGMCFGKTKYIKIFSFTIKIIKQFDKHLCRFVSWFYFYVLFNKGNEKIGILKIMDFDPLTNLLTATISFKIHSFFSQNNLWFINKTVFKRAYKINIR